MFVGRDSARGFTILNCRGILKKADRSECCRSQLRHSARVLTGLRRVVTINCAASTPPHNRPRRLAWPRTSPFHGGNTGSNPVGDANLINYLQIPSRILYVR
jgi:hypothetical protein